MEVFLANGLIAILSKIKRKSYHIYKFIDLKVSYITLFLCVEKANTYLTMNFRSFLL